MYNLFYALEQNGDPVTAWEFVQSYATLTNAQKRVDKDLVAYYRIEQAIIGGSSIVAEELP